MKKLIVFITLFFTASAWAQNVSPPDRSQIQSTQPIISANFNTQVYRPRMWVDGTEFTTYLQVNGGTVSLAPPYPLDNGVHQVRVDGGNGLQTSWSFAIANGNGNVSNQSNNGKHKGWYKNKNKNKNKNNPNYNNGQYNGGYNNGVIDASRYGPPAGSVVTVPNPPVSVAFNGTVQNLRMTVDGRDVTNEATIGNEGISWVPRSSLQRGQHSARVTGNALNGQPVSGEWNFWVQY